MNLQINPATTSSSYDVSTGGGIVSSANVIDLLHSSNTENVSHIEKPNKFPELHGLQPHIVDIHLV